MLLYLKTLRTFFFVREISVCDFLWAPLTDMNWTGLSGKAVETLNVNIIKENCVLSGSIEPKPLVFHIVLTASSCFTSSIILLIFLSTQSLLH